MFHVLNDESIPSDVGLAIEYQMLGSSLRIDMLLSGLDGSMASRVVVIELKQWSDDTIAPSDLEDHVLLSTDRSGSPHEHPCAQALDYADYFEGFYTIVSDGDIEIRPCAYVHNVINPEVLRNAARKDTLEQSPLFTKYESAELRNFVSKHIASGDKGSAISRLDQSPLAPSKELATRVGNMVKGNSEFKLMDRQRTALAQIKRLVAEAGPNGKRVLIVRGGPGTGKSVVAFHALGDLLKSGRNVRYVTKNAAPRNVYLEKLRSGKQSGGLKGLLVSSDSFHSHVGDPFDVLLVDEAHRLVHKSGVYRNLGSNQVEEIIGASRVTVFFLDETQAVTWRDMGTSDEIRSCANRLGAPVVEVELQIQFRCTGADDYVDWVDRVLGITQNLEEAWLSGSYMIDIVDSPAALISEIEKWNRNDSHRSSRLVAGYCWNWISRVDPSLDDIVLSDGFSRKWNLSSQGQAWLAFPSGADQVGCVYTVQGLEMPAVGVIMGPDLVVREGNWIFQPEGRAKTDRQSLWGWKQTLRDDPERALIRAREIVRNQYKVLLTRATRGTLIYSTDSETRTFLKEQILLSKERSLRVA